MAEPKTAPRHGTARLLWEAGREADDPDEAIELAAERQQQPDTATGVSDQ